MTEKEIGPKTKNIKAKRIAAGSAMVILGYAAWVGYNYEVFKNPVLDKKQQAIYVTIRNDTLKDPFAASCEQLRKTVKFDMQIANMGSVKDEAEANSLLGIMELKRCPPEAKDDKQK